MGWIFQPQVERFGLPTMRERLTRHSKTKLNAHTLVRSNRIHSIKKPTARSAVTNGRILPSTIDARKVFCRRLRDVCSAIALDLGGPDTLSEAERSIIRRVGLLEVEL